MFKVHVDFSVFTADPAFGMVSGELTFPIVPQVGDVIALPYIEHSATAWGPFSHLRVTTRIIEAHGDNRFSLGLEDVTAASLEDARRLVIMLQQVPGLVADVWEP